jgi:hypothetical protein
MYLRVLLNVSLLLVSSFRLILEFLGLSDFLCDVVRWFLTSCCSSSNSCCWWLLMFCSTLFFFFLFFFFDFAFYFIFCSECVPVVLSACNLNTAEFADQANCRLVAQTNPVTQCPICPIIVCGTSPSSQSTTTICVPLDCPLQSNLLVQGCEVVRHVDANGCPLCPVLVCRSVTTRVSNPPLTRTTRTTTQRTLSTRTTAPVICFALPCSQLAPPPPHCEIVPQFGENGCPLCPIVVCHSTSTAVGDPQVTKTTSAQRTCVPLTCPLTANLNPAPPCELVHRFDANGCPLCSVVVCPTRTTQSDHVELTKTTVSRPVESTRTSVSQNIESTRTTHSVESHVEFTRTSALNDIEATRTTVSHHFESTRTAHDVESTRTSRPHNTCPALQCNSHLPLNCTYITSDVGNCPKCQVQTFLCCSLAETNVKTFLRFFFFCSLAKTNVKSGFFVCM